MRASTKICRFHSSLHHVTLAWHLVTIEQNLNNCLKFRLSGNRFAQICQQLQCTEFCASRIVIHLIETELLAFLGQKRRKNLIIVSPIPIQHEYEEKTRQSCPLGILVNIQGCPFNEKVVQKQGECLFHWYIWYWFKLIHDIDLSVFEPTQKAT